MWTIGSQTRSPGREYTHRLRTCFGFNLRSKLNCYRGFDLEKGLKNPRVLCEFKKKFYWFKRGVVPFIRVSYQETPWIKLHSFWIIWQNGQYKKGTYFPHPSTKFNLIWTISHITTYILHISTALYQLNNFFPHNTTKIYHNQTPAYLNTNITTKAHTNTLKN